MIPHNRPTFDQMEAAAASRVLSSGWVAQGSETKAFEDELCEFFGIPEGHAIAVSSGSAALYLALWVLGGESKKIGLPVYACAALRNAVNLIGGKEVYLDCARNSPNIDMSAIDQGAIDILIAPSIFGIPVSFTASQDFKVIEDIAQSLGAVSSGKRIGLRGDVGICSFYATKMMTSGGQGGAIISRDKGLMDQLRDYRQFDCRNDSLPRFNFQMTDLQAAVGRIQLSKLPDFIGIRDNIFELYRASNSNLMDATVDSDCPARYRAVIQCSNPGKIILNLAKNGVSAIIPVESWELLADPEKYPFAHKLTKNTVSLPIYPSLSVSEIDKLVQTVRRFT
jgi:perosamine synthetase